MILRILLIVGMSLLIGSTLNAQSQRPPPTPGVNSNPDQKKTKSAPHTTEPYQQGTEQSPVIVKIMEAPKTQEEIQRDRNEREDQAANTRVIATFTKLLVLVAFLQFAGLLLQAWFLRKNFIATQCAAEAAKKSADVLPVIERAYVFVKIYLSQKFITDKGITEYVAQIGIVNGGKTPAVLLDCSYTARIIGLDEELPEISKIDPDKRWIPSGTVIIRANYERTESAIIQTSAIEMKSVESCINRLFCYGVIRYEDVFGKPHETGFCWEYQDRFKDFYPAKDHKRNYRT